MGFELLIASPAATDVTEKDTAENILLADLPEEYKVYAFYYPGQPVDAELERKLRAFGDQTGKNLLVNIGRYNDPQFSRLVSLFGIEKFPVMVVTALAPFAASQDEALTAYARLDNGHLLDSHERTLDCLEVLFNLFLQRRVADAVLHAKWAQRTEFLRQLGGVIGGALAKIAGLVFDRDIAISFCKIKLELKKH